MTEKTEKDIFIGGPDGVLLRGDTVIINPKKQLPKEEQQKLDEQIEKADSVARNFVESGEGTEFDIFQYSAAEIITFIAQDLSLPDDIISNEQKFMFQKNVYGDYVNIRKKFNTIKGYFVVPLIDPAIGLRTLINVRRIVNWSATLVYNDGLKIGYEKGLKEGRRIGKPFDLEKIKKGEAVRIKNADDHALKMYEFFSNNKELSEAKSIRSLTRILNEQQVETARGGQWGVKTVTDLYKRWERLGLKPNAES